MSIDDDCITDWIDPSFCNSILYNSHLTMPKRSAKAMVSTDEGNDNVPQVVDVQKLKSGDIISNTEYFVVESIGNRGSFKEYVFARTLDGTQSISFDLIKYNSYKTPTQFTETKKVPRTKIVEILQHHVKSHAFMVDFKKKDGSDRTMVARMVNFCGLFGRSEVMELKHDGTQKSFIEQKRLVDHRTIKRLVFNGVEYVSTSK